MAIRLRKPREGSAPAVYAKVADVAKLFVLVACTGIFSFYTNLATADLLIGPGEDSFDREVGSINGGGYTLNYELFLPPGHEEEGALPLSR
ncbi:MAG: hypothetical protein JXM70_17535 [Pirellulales bacterium]|nr:hypothetical protein [Pirellulales bacterium]